MIQKALADYYQTFEEKIIIPALPALYLTRDDGPNPGRSEWIDPDKVCRLMLLDCMFRFSIAHYRYPELAARIEVEIQRKVLARQVAKRLKGKSQ